MTILGHECLKAFPIKANDYSTKWFAIEPGIECMSQIREDRPVFPPEIVCNLLRSLPTGSESDRHNVP